MLIAAKDAATDNVWDLKLALLAGGIALVGAFIGFLGAIYTKRKELERADRVRWDDQILKDALEILDLSEWIRTRSFVDDRDTIAYTAKMRDQPGKEQRFRAIHNRLQLIASKKVIEEAERLLSSTLRLGEQRKGHDIKLARDAAYSTVESFREAVRKELNARD